MNGIDILILLVLIYGAWKGWHSGLIKQAFGIIGVFVGLYVARLLYEQVGEELAPHLGTSASIANIVAFVVIWVGTPILLGILGEMLTYVLKWVYLGGINSLLGCVVGVVKYMFLLGAVANVLNITHLMPEEAQQKSLLFNPMKATTSIAFDMAQQQWVEMKSKQAHEPGE